MSPLGLSLEMPSQRGLRNNWGGLGMRRGGNVVIEFKLGADEVYKCLEITVSGDQKKRA